ncbi:10375_t:CDS:2, partial [Acaulospora colombiana]
MFDPATSSADEISDFVLVNADRAPIITTVGADHASVLPAVGADRAPVSVEVEQPFSFTTVEVDQASIVMTVCADGLPGPATSFGEEVDEEYERSIVNASPDEWDLLATFLNSMGARRESPSRRALAHVWKNGRAPRDQNGHRLPPWGPYLLIINPTRELHSSTGKFDPDALDDANYWVVNNPEWEAKPEAASGVKRKASSEKGE